MSTEHGPNNSNQELHKLLQVALDEIEDQIPIEQDCDGIDRQLVRDMFYESNGSAFELSQARWLNVVTPTIQFKLAPIGETPFGVLCEMLDVTTEDNEPELLLVCGTLFGANSITEIDNVHSVNDTYWPIENEATLYEPFYLEDINIALNRRLATHGRLAMRPTYNNKEFAELLRDHPDSDIKSKYVIAELPVNGRVVKRAVPYNIGITEPILALEAELKNGELQLFT